MTPSPTHFLGENVKIYLQTEKYVLSLYGDYTFWQ